MNINLDINETRQQFNLDIGESDAVNAAVAESGQTVPLTIDDSSEQQSLGAEATIQSFDIGLSEAISVSGIPDYTGSYEVVPTTEQQTLFTRGLRAARNIVIDPIPTNYGLITYNGTTITVS